VRSKVTSLCGVVTVTFRVFSVLFICTRICYVGSEVLTAVIMESNILCRPLQVSRSFGGIYGLSLQG
jgi:hypothetical protein